MHPKHHLPFEDWLRKIASCIQMMDVAFKTELGPMIIFDVMPTFRMALASECGNIQYLVYDGY
jgi:hypothetical protein